MLHFGGVHVFFYDNWIFWHKPFQLVNPSTGKYIDAQQIPQQKITQTTPVFQTVFYPKNPEQIPQQKHTPFVQPSLPLLRK